METGAKRFRVREGNTAPILPERILSPFAFPLDRVMLGRCRRACANHWYSIAVVPDRAESYVGGGCLFCIQFPASELPTRSNPCHRVWAVHCGSIVAQNPSNTLNESTI